MPTFYTTRDAALFTVLIAPLGGLGSAALVAGLYLVKSAAGIDLMEGHSVLHDLLYHFVA
jgi:hypothetical protein